MRRLTERVWEVPSETEEGKTYIVWWDRHKKTFFLHLSGVFKKKEVQTYYEGHKRGRT